MSSPLPVDSSGEISFRVRNEQDQDDICNADTEVVSDCGSCDRDMIDQAMNTSSNSGEADLQVQITSMAVLLRDVVNKLESMNADKSCQNGISQENRSYNSINDIQDQSTIYNSLSSNHQGQDRDHYRQPLGQRSTVELQGQEVRSKQSVTKNVTNLSMECSYSRNVQLRVHYDNSQFPRQRKVTFESCCHSNYLVTIMHLIMVRQLVRHTIQV